MGNNKHLQIVIQLWQISMTMETPSIIIQALVITVGLKERLTT